MATYSPQSLGINASTTGGTFQQGAWYNGRQYWNGTLGDVGVIHPDSNQQGAGKAVSNEVVAQTNPSNVKYIEAERMKSSGTPAYTSGQSQTTSVVNSVSSQVEKARKALEDSLIKRQTEVDTKLNELKQKEQETLDQIGELSQPFREELEKAERERLYVNENFEANQQLVNELEQLLTEGNEAIRQQQQVTGLSAIRNPRVQQTINDVAARAGVIESVISARNGQIAQANNLIDRTIGAINADRQQEISYYETILSLNRQDILSLDSESKKLADERLGILKSDYKTAQDTASYIKQLLVNPDTAALMGEAGVSLNDSIESINAKLTWATHNREIMTIGNDMSMAGYQTVLDPKSVPANQLVTITDSTGQKHYYRKNPAASGSGLGGTQQWVLDKYLGGSGAEVDGLTAEDYAIVKSVASQVTAPTMSPANGIGTRYTDPFGVQWIYDRNGWRRLSN